MKVRVLALLLAVGGAAVQAVADGSWETLAADAAAPLTVALGDTPAPWKIEVSFSGVQAFSALSINNKYPQLVGLTDDATSVYLSVNGWDNSRDLFLTGNRNGTQAGTPLGNVNGNNDVGNGELWAPTNGVITLLLENDGTHLTVSQNGHTFIKTDKNTASGRLSSVAFGGGLVSQLGGGRIASARIWRECFATVVRAHPRLTSGLARESLVGMKFAGRRAGALGEVAFRFDLTNCAARQISDVRLWRQKYDPVPFAFYERDAVDLTANGYAAVRTEADGALTVTFSPTGGVAQTVYPQAEGRGESDYLWVTAKVADDLAADAEIWSSFVGDTVMLGDNAFTVTNGVAKAPHRPFPYRYQIGAYVRQDRLVGNGSTTWDIFSNATSNRIANLTDIIVIYSLAPTCSDGKFQFGHWDSGRNDTASTAHIVANRNLYHPQCLVRGSIEKGASCTANGITGGAFEVAGAGVASREQFAQYVVDFCKAKGLDGMDLDYEWATGSTNHRQWQNIGKMMRELSERFFDAGLVLSLSTRSHDTVSTGGMPDDAADWGAFHTADYITSQAYGAGNINAGPTIQRRALEVCTRRGVPKRRVVLGQAIYSCQDQWGWDQAVSYIQDASADRLRRFDMDIAWTSRYSSYQMFEGVSSYHTQCDWARSENCGGVMSWGYYTDPGWDGWCSLGRHQAQAIWPMPRVRTTPEQEDGWYVIRTEGDWFWLYDHTDVRAKLGSDVTLTHDPLVMPEWTGTLDGDGHVLTIAEDAWVTSGEATGLVRNLRGTVRNLTVRLDGRVYTLAGRWNDNNWAMDTARVTNATSGDNPVGVIAAEAGADAVVENVTVVLGATSEVKGVKYAGGLVGRVGGAAVITNNAVEVGGKLQVEIRNSWDTLFQPAGAAVDAVCAKVVAESGATIGSNAFAVVAGGEIQDLAYVPPAVGEIAGEWREPTGFDWALPRDVDVRSEAYAVEVELELPQFNAMSFGESYPQLVRLVGDGTSVALGVSTAGGCELFLTGNGAASYAYPVSRAAIRSNGDVGSGVGLSVGEDGRVRILVENRRGELRVYQNGELILVTDKNTSATGYVRSAVVGSGVAALGGGRIVSLRVKTGRSGDIVHPAGYGKLVFDEEFDGTVLDCTKWEKVPDDARHINWKQYTSHREDLVAVSNGCLVLTGVLNDGSDGDGRRFLCGQVQSSGKFNFRYGVIEIRAKFEDQDGAWPAMWMMPQNSVHGGWPRSGEIDITERLNADAKVYQTAHFGQTDTTAGTTAAIDNGVFNVYRLEWTENKITWYVNGVATHSYSDPGTGYLAWPFDSPYYVILSQQLEGSWVGTVDDTSTLPVRMYVDYVRVWQKDAETVPNNACLWLDAANADTIETNGLGEVTSWRSANACGRAAHAYALASHSPSGPTNANGLVSFGDTAADRDLAFDRATDIRAVYMVGRMEPSANAFLLGDSAAYHFHRGENGEYWSGNAAEAVRNGTTRWNGDIVASPTTAKMPEGLGLFELHAAGDLTASQLCYDRLGNGDVPRRGGKDIAELVVFSYPLGYAERLRMRKYLTDKWLAGVPHPNWSITDDWVLRQENDLSAGVSPARAFADGAGTYEFRNVRFTGGLQQSAYTVRVQAGDSVVIDGTGNNNGRCQFGFDVRGGRVTFPAGATTWYENAHYRQSGGEFVSFANGQGQSGTGAGFMLGYNGRTMALDVSGGLFAVTNSSLNFYDPLTLNVGGTGTVRAKGVFRSSSSAATVNVNEGGAFEVGALGWKAGSCTLNLNGGTLAAYEDGAAVHNALNVAADSALRVPTGVTLAVDGGISGDGRLSLVGGGRVVFTLDVRAAAVRDGVSNAVLKVSDDFPLDRCTVRLACSGYDGTRDAAKLEVRGGVLYATPEVDADIFVPTDAVNDANHVFTACQYQSSFYRGKAEYQPLIGVRADRLRHTGMRYIAARLSDGTDPSIISDCKLYVTTTPYFTTDATELTADDLVKTMPTATDRTVKFDFWSRNAAIKNIAVGNYLWICVKVAASAPAHAELDAKITGIVMNGFQATVYDVDPQGAGEVYPYEYHVVPYWRMNGWTMSALTRQHFACYTEVIPFYITVGSDGSVGHGWNGEQFTDEKFRAAIDRMCELRAGKDVKLLVGVGFSQGNLPSVCADAATRKAAARNLAAFVRKFGLDGVDFDWEYPTAKAHWEGWCNLVADLKPLLFKQGGGKLVSVAVTGWRTQEGGGTLGAGEAVKGLYQQCDFVNMMSYDGGEWASHATLDLMKNDFARAMNYGKIPAYRVCGGQAFYTNHYPCDGSQNGYGWVVGNYPQYVDATDRFTGSDGKVYTYNSIATIKSKCAYAKSIGGGVMIWANETDTALTHAKSATRAMFSQIRPSRCADDGDLVVGDGADWAAICSCRGTVTLTNDITVTAETLRPETLVGVLNGNGHTITVTGGDRLLTEIAGVVSNLHVVVTGDIAASGVLAKGVSEGGLLADDVTLEVRPGANVIGGLLPATPSADIRTSAYLWLDASRKDTLVTNAAGQVTQWKSANPAGGIGAATYSLATYPPNGPTVGADGLVSFGDTDANRDLCFEKTANLRTVFMVAKVRQSANAFLLGDPSAYHFHRGDNGTYWHGGHSSANVRNGKTYWNGVQVTAPVTTAMPGELGLVTVETAGGVTASQLCYDRAGNGSTPRRGGKDIAELLLFEKPLGAADRRFVENYLMAKWGLGDRAALVITNSPASYPEVVNAELLGRATTNGTFAIVNTTTDGAEVVLDEVPDVATLDLVFSRRTSLTLPGGGAAAFSVPSNCAVTVREGGWAGAISAEDATAEIRFAGTSAIAWPLAGNVAFPGLVTLACPLSDTGRTLLVGNKRVVFDYGSSLDVDGLNLGNENGVTQSVAIRGGEVVVSGDSAPTNTYGSVILGHWPSTVRIALEEGAFTARGAAAMLGWDGHVYLTVSGGRMTLKGLLANRPSSRDNTSSVVLSGGELALGDEGLDFTGRSSRNASFTLAGGKLSCYADATVRIEHADGLNVTAASTLAAAPDTTLTVAAPLKGAGALTLDAPGGMIALADLSGYAGAFTVTDGTALRFEVTRSAEQIAACEPVEVVTLPPNVTAGQCTVRFVNAATGRKTAATLTLANGVLTATPQPAGRQLTYTPTQDGATFVWDGTEGAFDGATFSDFDHVAFRRVLSGGNVLSTAVTVPAETWAGNVGIGGSVSLTGSTLHAKVVGVTNAVFAAQSLVADAVAVGAGAVILADGVWAASLSVPSDATIRAVGDGVWALGGSSANFAENMTFDLSGYAVRTSGKHYVVTGDAASWPTSTLLRVAGDLPLYKDDAGYFTSAIVSVAVTNGETRVAGSDVYDYVTVEAGGTLVWRGTKLTVADTITFDAGAKIALAQADGSKILYRTGLGYDLVTAKRIVGIPANDADFNLAIVDNADGTQTLRATRNLGSARVVRAHPLLTRGVGQESLVGIDFSGTYGGNVTGVTFRLRLENMTADDIGNFKLWRMPYGTPYAFYAPGATDLSPNYAVEKTVSADGREITLAYSATGGGVWIYPEMSGLRDCSDRLWLTAELQNLKTLSDDARVYSDVLDTAFSLGGNVFKTENGIAAAPHRPYPWRYLVTAYMRRDRIGPNAIGMLSDAPEMRWPSLTHVIVSSFNVEYSRNDDSLRLSWDDAATGAFRTLREFRDRHHPQCRLVPSLTKGGYVSLDSRQAGSAESRYAIAHAGEKQYRAAFVRHVVAKMLEIGADGLDIDWEYPDDNGKDYNAYGLLMRDLAEAFFDHGWDLSMCSNFGYRMPGGEVMAAADYISSMAYGQNRGLHAMNTAFTGAVNMLVNRNVPRRRIVVGQAIYSTAKWHMGWDELAGRCGNDDDIIAESWSYNGSSGDFIGFTGPTTYRAKCNRAKGVYPDGYEYGGVMSWGYYCDTGWRGGKSLGWNQRQTVWPRPYNFPTPEVEVKGEGEGEERTYVLKSEDDWHWFEENAASVQNARLAADIAFDHDPKPIPAFAGTFDGGGHTLTVPVGVWVVAFERAALFQTLTGTLRNLKLDVAGRFICRNDRKNDVQSGWSLSAHGGDGANTAALVAEANAGARIENVGVVLRAGSEIRGNHEVGALVGQAWSGGAGIVISNCTVDCAGTVWAKAVDSVNVVITGGGGETGNGRVGLLVGSLNFNGDSQGVTLVDCSATLRPSGSLQSVCGNYRTVGGLVGNLHVGAENAKFAWRGLKMSYGDGAVVSGPANTSGTPYRCQPFFGYTFGASGAAKPALDGASALIAYGTVPSGFDASVWLTAPTASPWTLGGSAGAAAPLVLDAPLAKSVSASYLTASVLADLPEGASGDVVFAQCTGGYGIWAQVSPESSGVLSVRLGYTQPDGRHPYGPAVTVMPGPHQFALAMSGKEGTMLYVDGAAVQAQTGLKFSNNPFEAARFGFAGVGMYAWDVLPGAVCSVTYPSKAAYPEANVIETTADDDALTIGNITYPASPAAATLTAELAMPEAFGPVAAWAVGKDSSAYVVEACRESETSTKVAWRNAGEAARTYAAQNNAAIDGAGVKVLNFTYNAGSGSDVALNAQYAASSSATKWGGSKVTGASLGLRAGMLIGERALTLGASNGPDAAHPLCGLADEPAWYPTMSEALRDYYRDTIVETMGAYEPPPVTFNGREMTGADSAKVIFLFGGNPDAADDYALSLDAPRIADGNVGIGLSGRQPVNAALQLQTATELGGAWRVAAEIPAGSAERSFSFPMAIDGSFYRVVAAESRTGLASPAMPVDSRSMAQANLGTLALDGGALLTVTLAGSGVAEGMLGYLCADGVAYVGRVGADGTMAFDFGAAAPAAGTQAALTLVIPRGATNGTIRVASPTVSQITYPDALVTEVVADTLKADGFSELSGFGQFRIPALVSDGAGEVLCCYDVRYGGGDLGTGDGIDVGETYSADFGRTFARPYLAIDVTNTRNERNETIAEARDNDLGDVCVLYDDATATYWMMGMGGRGLNDGRYDWNDVILYTRGKGEGRLKWQKFRSVQAEIAAQPGIANGSGGYGFGFLQGPGHGFVTAKDAYTNGTDGAALAMPKGTLVFPMQYFVDSSFTASSVGAVYSTDHGQTWTATRRSATADGPQENCIMELDDGSWYMTAKAGYRGNNEAETGKFKFFRSTDFQTWTAVGVRAPVPCQQGSCLRLGTNAADGRGRYVFCHTLDRRAGVRSQVALVFGTDTTAAGDAAGIEWDYGNPLMLYLCNTGFKGYNSLAMVDKNTLGVLYEAQGHIYFIRIDVSGRLK